LWLYLEKWHQLTNSPTHQLTTSPTHQLVNSQPHNLTNSPTSPTPKFINSQPHKLNNSQTYHKLYKTHTSDQPLLAKIMAKMYAFSKKLRPYAFLILSSFEKIVRI